MRYYVYAIHTEDTRNLLLHVFDNRVEAGAMEQELQSSGLTSNNCFIRMFPATNVDEARIKADEMRPIPPDAPQRPVILSEPDEAPSG